MKLKIDYKQPPRLVINGQDYHCDIYFKGSDHVYNNSGSTITLKNVFPVKKDSLGNWEKIQSSDLFEVNRIENWSLGQIFFGDKLWYFGIVKLQQSNSMSPFELKTNNITLVSAKEFLTRSFMDFLIFSKKPEDVVDMIIEKLQNKYVTKGIMTFTKETTIKAYNTKSMNAYDVLKLIERLTQSILVIKDSDTGISINFFSRESIKNPVYNNVGTEIIYLNDSFQKVFWQIGKVFDMKYELSSQKDHNISRVESERVVSNIDKTTEIDLDIVSTNHPLGFPIASANKTETKLLKSDGTEIRKLIIETREKAEQTDYYDIAYNPGDEQLLLNTRLFNNPQGSKIVFKYKYVQRQSFDFIDSISQQKVKTLTGTNGELIRQEKYNDHSSIDNLIDTGEHLRQIGAEEKWTLTISMLNPLWELGNNVTFDGGNSDYKFLSGDYIVREVDFEIIVNDEAALITKFTYTLIKGIDLENEWNFYDNQAYRDNNIIDDEFLIISQTSQISQSIWLCSKTLNISVTDVDLTGLDYSLDFRLGLIDESEIKYTPIEI